MDKQTDELIVKYCKYLRLSAIRRGYEEFSRQAITEQIQYEPSLPELTEREYEMRTENFKKALIRAACFPSRIYLSDLQKQHLPEDTQKSFPCWSDLIF